MALAALLVGAEASGLYLGRVEAERSSQVILERRLAAWAAENECVMPEEPLPGAEKQFMGDPVPRDL